MSTSRAFSRSGFMSIASIFVGIVTGILAARVLGPTDRGYLGLIVFWPQFVVALGRLPFSDVIVVTTNQSDSVSGLGQTYRTAVKYALIWSGLYLPVLLVTLYVLVGDRPGDIWLLSAVFGIVLLFCSQQTQVFTGIFRATKQFDLLNLFRLTVPVSYLVLGGALAFFGFGLLGFVVAHVMSMLISYGFRFAISKSEDTFQECEEDELDTSHLRSALWTFFWANLFTFLATSIDRAFVMTTLGVAEIGIYLVAMTVAGPLNGIIGTMMQSVGLPQLAAVAPDQRANSYIRLLRLTWASSIAITAVIACLAPIFVPLLFGRDFSSAGLLASAIAVTTLLVPLRQALAQVLMAERKETSVTFANLVYMLVFAAAYVAARRFGLSWPVVYGLGFANLVATGLLWMRLRASRDDMATLKWLILERRSFTELFRVAISGLSSGVSR